MDPARRRWLALGVVCLGQAMMVLDVTIVNVALPDIQRDLGFSTSSLTWVPNAYLIAFGAFLLLAGRLGDLLGRTQMFLTGLAVFTLASLACGLATSEAALIVARFVQGLGSAITASGILALIVVEFPSARERATATSAYTFVSVAGGSIGLLAGGVLTQALDWHWIFFINLPLGVLAFALGWAVLDRRPGLGLGKDLDVLGSVLITLASVVGIYGIVQAEETGIAAPRTLGLLAAAAVLLAVFLRLEQRVASPILPPHVLRLRSLMISCGVRALMVVGMYATFFLGALHFEQVRGLSPAQTGAAFLPQTLVVAALSLGITSRMSARFGARPVLLGGLATMAVGIGLLALLLTPEASYFPGMGLAFMVIGLGAGSSFMTLVQLALADVPAADAGIASGIVNVSVQLGGAVGVALLGTIAASRTGALRDGGASVTEALTAGHRLAVALAAGIVAVALALAAVLLRPAREPELAVVGEPA